MALWADLMVNNQRIGTVEIVRTAGGNSPDSRNTYAWELAKVRKSGVVRGASVTKEAGGACGTVTHKCKDGAVALMAKALTAAAKAGA